MENQVDLCFDKSIERSTFFPIQDKYLFDMLKANQATFWIPSEIDLSQDIAEYERLKPEERYYINHVLSFFSQSDFIVNTNLESFIEHVTLLELKMVLHYQEMIEDVHSETYGLLLETFIRDEKEREIIKNGTLSFPAVKGKQEWCYKYIQQGTLVERLIAFAIVENLFFAGSFCAIFWLRKQGKMNQGLAFSNQLIARDESQHVRCAIYVYKNLIKNKLPEEQVIDMIKCAIEQEKAFIMESLPVNLIGMNAEAMLQYVQFCADGLASQLINQTIYNVVNPFPWMDLISLQTKENFFETRVSNYSKQIAQHEIDKVIRFDAKY